MDPNTLRSVLYRIVATNTPVYEMDHRYIVRGTDVGPITRVEPPEGDVPYFNPPENDLWFKCTETIIDHNEQS